MEKNIYLIRHCEAEGQDPQSPLTERGVMQAKKLSIFLSDIKVERIICSPYTRATQSIRPFAESKCIDIEIDNRLTERVLSSNFFPDWMDKLEATFNDMELKYQDGESSIEAMHRITGVVNDITKSHFKNTILVSHGGILALLLNFFDKNIGFEQWKKLTNPDVFLLHITPTNINIKRLWKE